MPDEPHKVLYLWVMRDGVPVSYVYPWPSDGQVEKLQDEWRKKEETGYNFYLSDDRQTVAEYRQRKPLPPKEETP